ncbi:hypothetical protein GLOIN_2v1884028 [Rhizophagus clarus]|uniref:Uncharacterized protein n=1 Tax=Rhizophagus clarus TaxID=94130 RepID=A0A8H3MF10_9GLOM|nr:hypothetical protein GLOIN_2v1884028 [Rhizophagus clarus]
MDKNPPQDNRFIEFNNLQQSTAAVIQSGHEHSSNIDYNAVNVNVDHYAMMNDNNILPPYTNINHFNQQSNISTSQSYPPHHMRHNNPYLNSSSNNDMGNQFTQFNQFQR